MTRKSLILAVASGIFIFLSFPKFGHWFFAWIALIPLFSAIKNKEPHNAMMLGFITGIISNVGIIYWVTYAIVKYGNLPIYTGLAAMLLLATYLALYTAMFSCCLTCLLKKNIPHIISAPMLWTGFEFIKSNLFTGFPWENLAYSQYMNLTVIQFADITGIYGISFLIIFINSVIYEAIFTSSQKRVILSKILFALVIISSVYCYGIFRIKYINLVEKGQKRIEVNLIQGNIDQNIKWNDYIREETIHIYRELSIQKQMHGTGLIVWPETAIPFYFQDVDSLHKMVIEIAQNTNNWLLAGSPSYIKENNGIFALNSAFLISPLGAIIGKYDKVHLVPFGEYVPLRKYLPFIEKIVVGIGDFKAGNDYIPITMDELKLGVMICYEGIFPDIARTYKQKETGLFINITNDAWYGLTSAPYQHLSMVIFRSIENRLYLVRAANTGISAIIDATGKILAKTELFKRTSLQGTVTVMNEQTIYARYGDIFAYICVVFSIIIFVMSRRKGERT